MKYTTPALYSIVIAAAGIFGNGCAQLPTISREAQCSRAKTYDHELLQNAFWQNAIGAYAKEDNTTVVVVAQGGLEDELNHDRTTPEGTWTPKPNDIELEWNKTPINDNNYSHSLTAYVISNALERKRFLQYTWNADNNDTCTITTYDDEVVTGITLAPLERGEEQARLFNAYWNHDRRNRTAFPIRVLLTGYEGTLEGTIEGTPFIGAIYRAALDKGRPFEFGEPDNVGGFAGWLGQHKTAEAYHPLSWLLDLVRAGITRPLVNLFGVLSPGLENRIANDTLEGTDYIILPLKSIAEALDGALKGNQLDRILLAPVSNINGELGIDSIGNEKSGDTQARQIIEASKAAATLVIRAGGASGSGNIAGNNSGGGISGGNTFTDSVGGQ